MALLPLRDAVYVVDYANLAMTDGCSALAFRQVPRGEREFELRPLAP